MGEHAFLPTGFSVAGFAVRYKTIFYKVTWSESHNRPVKCVTLEFNKLNCENLYMATKRREILLLTTEKKNTPTFYS